MVAAFLTLSGRIRHELAELERVVARIEEGWRRARAGDDDYYLDGVALNLHGFYAGLERIFELIAVEVDGYKPAGAQWHLELLRQMSFEIPGLRSPVISTATASRLDPYCGLRHVVRNVYTFDLDVERIEHLVESLRLVFATIAVELSAFADQLEGLSGIDENAP